MCLFTYFIVFWVYSKFVYEFMFLMYLFMNHIRWICYLYEHSSSIMSVTGRIRNLCHVFLFHLFYFILFHFIIISSRQIIVFIYLFLFLFCNAATQLATQLPQGRMQVVHSNKVALKCLTKLNSTPAMDFGCEETHKRRYTETKNRTKHTNKIVI